jgi:hypothetical protein
MAPLNGFKRPMRNLVTMTSFKESVDVLHLNPSVRMSELSCYEGRNFSAMGY